MNKTFYNVTGKFSLYSIWNLNICIDLNLQFFHGIKIWIITLSALRRFYIKFRKSESVLNCMELSKVDRKSIILFFFLVILIPQKWYHFQQFEKNLPFWALTRISRFKIIDLIKKSYWFILCTSVRALWAMYIFCMWPKISNSIRIQFT